MMKLYSSLFHVLGLSAITLVFAFGITWVLSKVPVLDPIADSVLDFEFADQPFKKKGYSQVPMDTNIFIVNIGYYLRYQLAGMIDSLNQYDPRWTILVLLFLSDSTEIYKQYVIER